MKDEDISVLCIY